MENLSPLNELNVLLKPLKFDIENVLGTLYPDSLKCPDMAFIKDTFSEYRFLPNIGMKYQYSKIPALFFEIAYFY